MTKIIPINSVVEKGLFKKRYYVVREYDLVRIGVQEGDPQIPRLVKTFSLANIFKKKTEENQ